MSNTSTPENCVNFTQMESFTTQNSVNSPIDSCAESKESYNALYNEDLIAHEDKIKINNINTEGLTLIEFIQKMDNTIDLRTLKESIFFYIIENEVDKNTLKMLTDCMISCSEKMIQYPNQIEKESST